MKAEKNARARLRAAREQEAKKSRVRRQVTVAALVVAVFAVIAVVVIACGRPGHDERGAEVAAALKGPLVVPKHTSGDGGTVITYGDPGARRTLDVYEDPRCPFCGIVERDLGATMQQLADKGTYKINYHMATFLDTAFGGYGSKSALNALGAAIDQGPRQFAALHAALYRDQPKESEDTFADKSKLLALAAKVPALDQLTMKKAVNSGTYLPWAAKVNEASGKSLSTAWKKSGAPGAPGTPAVFLDGQRLNLVSGPTSAISADDFKALVAKTP